ncbi:MAG: glycosyltransferase family 4 protein [Taibaiella sp.]|nr:glycosyltransferase family 4 protein [Taibaiella sp.]
MKQRVLFLNLTTFSKTGGIERFNKCFLKALSELDDMGIVESRSISAYDIVVDERYYSSKKYKGFGTNKPAFVVQSILAARKSDIIFLGHINMAVVGVLIKKMFPLKKVVLITHGIDVWRPLNGARAKILGIVDKIFSVSNFTKSKLIELHNVLSDRVQVFPNTIDPFFPIPSDVTAIDTLDKRYGIEKTDFVIYTLTRLSSTELFKGYDRVIEAMGELVKEHKNIKYVIAGKYDTAEKQRIDELIKQYSLEGHVLLAGYIDEGELVDHYRMADVFIMPSKKEGFGIVFIEALVCGLPVVAGNADGSVDALVNGELGTLVNPDSTEDIKSAILRHLEMSDRDNVQERLDIRRKTLGNFSFEKYRQRLEDFIASC